MINKDKSDSENTCEEVLSLNQKNNLLYAQQQEVDIEIPYNSKSMYIIDLNFDDNAEWSIEKY